MAYNDTSRRAFLQQAIALAAALPLGCGQNRKRRDAAPLVSPAPGSPRDAAPAKNPFAELEASSGGRLGVCVLETGSGESAGNRLDERFGMCSTFKVLLAGAILSEVDRGQLSLETAVRFTKADIVPYAPVTSKSLGRGQMTIAQLAEAAQTTSDNVAANLLLRELGGPGRFTEILRRTGDKVTRLDRYEPDMNHVPAGEVRDTTSPRAMAESVRRFVLTDVLSAESKARLRSWMEKTRTGRKRLRSGLPPDWPVGNKTGTGIAAGIANKTNDVAIVFPPEGAPRVIAAYYESDGHYRRIRDQDQAVLAEVGRLAAVAISSAP